MRIIVVSDTHRRTSVLREIIYKHKADMDMLIFCGDGLDDVDRVRLENPDLTIYAVRGNCDFSVFDEPAARTVETKDGTRIFVTHGHLYGVNSTLTHLIEAAKQNEAQIAVYGHTHVAKSVYQDEVYVLNPGSASCPRAGKASYGIIDITKGGIIAFNVEL